MKQVQYIDPNFLEPKDAWSKLSMEEKSDVIKAGVTSGFTSLSDIKRLYNAAMSDEPDTFGESVIGRANSSGAEFVQRLKDPDRQAIRDWETDGIATHKLSVGTDEKGNHYVYPEVQNIDGKLVDFTRPPYDKRAGRKSAEERGDTVRVPSIEEGVRFTQNYKQYYPKGNTFEIGGPKKVEAGPIDSTFMATNPSPLDIAARAALNYSQEELGHKFPITEEVPELPAPIDRDEVRRRQAFMETEFNDKAVSRTGAMGRWQIMPNTLEEYTKKTGKTGDLVNPEFNGEVRDWYVDNLLDRSWVTKGEASDSVQWGKALAAYNYGPTNVVNTLNKAKKEGVDIYNGWSWLDYMPQETQDYVNFVLRNKDINKYKNQERYDKAVKKQNKKELGGPLVQESIEV